MEMTGWTTRYGDIDVLLGIPKRSQHERAQYPALARDGLTLEVDGHQIRLAPLAAIIRSKEIANRPKDHEALPQLREINSKPTALKPGDALNLGAAYRRTGPPSSDRDAGR
jgi:hypothetical protein